MTFYLVKEVSTATPANTNFLNKVITSYHGVGDHLVASDSDRNYVSLSSWEIAYYGYKRKCDALRNWTYKNPENSKYWKSTVEIVEYIVE